MLIYNIVIFSSRDLIVIPLKSKFYVKVMMYLMTVFGLSLYPRGRNNNELPGTSMSPVDVQLIQMFDYQRKVDKQ